MKMKAILPLLMLGALGAARAHVVLDQPEAVAGSAYKAVLRVGHGCAGAPTRALVVTLPAGLRGAHPTPKPGWVLQTRKAALAQPYESHGRRIEEDVVEISWTARSEADYLQDDWADEFVLRGSLPAAAGALWFKVRQVCVGAESDWSELPPSGVSTQGLKFPAARLLLSAPAPAATSAQAH